MTTFVLTILVLILFSVIAFGILRAVVQAWVDHRVRLVLLENLERHPESETSPNQLLSNVAAVSHSRRHDYTLTGVLLAIIGISCSAYGRFTGFGRLAVGLYVGGMICIALGVVLALVGLLIYYLSNEIRETPARPSGE